MKYKVGDKVRIVDEFLPDSAIGGDMPSYRGKTVTIARTDTRHGDPCYYIEEDSGYYYWLEKTIAGYAYRITIEEFFASEEKLVIHCKTEEEANVLLTVFRRMHKTWINGDAYTSDKNNWSHFQERTYYSNQGTYGSTSSFITSQLYKFDEVDLGETPIPESAMQILLRDTLKWEAAIYDRDSNRIKIKRSGATVAELNILAIKNDERSSYVKCPKCGEIIKNTPEEIAAHLAKKTNCLTCPHVRDNMISKIDVTYEKMPDGTYIKNAKTSCSLYCNQTWSGTDINSPEVKRACKYRNCNKDAFQVLDGFFGKYPDAFDVIATVDTLADKWKFSTRWNDSFYYNFGGRTRLTAVVNDKGTISQFQYSYYDDTYSFAYSAKYHKIIWMINGEYKDKAPSNIKAQNITRLTNIMKEIYEETTK